MPRRPGKPATKLRRAPQGPGAVSPLDYVAKPRKGAPAALLDASSGRERAERSIERAARAEPVQLSTSYRAALEMEVEPHEAEDADAFRTALLQGLKRWRGGRGVKVADAVAASMLARPINLIGRDGVLAAREIADRTEGPVVQRTDTRSVSYVVSVTPAGGLGSGSMQPQTPEEWEKMAHSDWAAAQGSPPLLEAQVGNAQGPTGSRR